MIAENAALGCRAVILLGYFMVASLSIVNSLDSITKFRRKHYLRDLTVDLLGNAGQGFFVAGAIYGTYTRLDKEFTWGLPAMALGLTLYVVHLLIKKKDFPPSTPSETELNKPLCGIDR